MRLLITVAWLILGAFQIGAYLAGMKLWLGLGTVLSIVAFFSTAAIPAGALIDACISFYGAHAAWHWTWWQAALLTFPFAILGLILSGFNAIVAIIERMQGHRRLRL